MTHASIKFDGINERVTKNFVARKIWSTENDFIVHAGTHMPGIGFNSIDNQQATFSVRVYKIYVSIIVAQTTFKHDVVFCSFYSNASSIQSKLKPRLANVQYFNMLMCVCARVANKRILSLNDFYYCYLALFGCTHNVRHIL